MKPKHPPGGFKPADFLDPSIQRLNHVENSAILAMYRSSEIAPLAADDPDSNGYVPRMGIQHINRIRELRTQRGWSQAKLAEEVGCVASTIKRLESGDRRLTQNWMHRLANALGVKPVDLIEKTNQPIVECPLISWVQAGELVEAFDPYLPGAAEKRVPVPYHRRSIVALRVEGESMNLVAPAGSIIICDYEDRLLVDGKFYVIRHENSATFKRYRANPDRFEPVSTLQDFQTIFPQKDGFVIVGRVVMVTQELL